MANVIKILSITFLLGMLTACGGSDETPKPEDASEQATAAQTSADSIETALDTAVDTVVEKVETEMKAQIDKSDPNWKLKVTEPAMMAFEPGKTYIWQLETNQGTMKFRLFHEQSPMHVNSTIYLTEIGFYDDVLFHRVIPGFMAQGGDPTGTGTSGPAYRYDGEFAPGLSHSKAGMLSMANAGPGTDGSQFFITFQATPFLDGKHTLFGELTEGMEVLQALEARGSRGGRTSEELKIVKASVLVQ